MSELEDDRERKETQKAPQDEPDEPQEDRPETPDWFTEIQEEEYASEAEASLGEEEETAETPPSAPEAERELEEEDRMPDTPESAEEDHLPTWLEDHKEEEEPQDTAIAWLSDFQDYLDERQPPPAQKEPSKAEEGEGPEEPEAAPEEELIAPDTPSEEAQIPPEEKPVPAPAAESDISPETPEGEPEVEKPEEEAPEEPPDWVIEGEPPDDGGEEYAWLPAEEKYDLNQISLAQLETFENIGFTVAEGILAYREEHGPFADIQELLDVPQVDEEHFAILAKHLEIIPAPEEAPAEEPEDEYEALLLQAKQAVEEDDLEQALEDYETLIEEKEKLPEVIDALSDVSYQHPMNVSVLKLLGDAYMRVNQLQKALDAYSRAEDLLR
jgi:hypothetical protein